MLLSLSASLLALLGGIVLRLRVRRRRARSYDDNPSRHQLAGAAGVGDLPAADEVAGADLDADDQASLDEAARQLILDTSPQTGERPSRRRRSGVRPATDTAPVARSATTGSAVSASFDDARPGTVNTPTYPQLPPRAPMPPLERANLLAELWDGRDTDQLAALAAGEPETALAAYVLAAAAASAVRDPRAFSYLQAAFTDGRDPETEPLLAPYLNQLAFSVVADDLELNEDLACSRTAIGCALACSERLVGDSESAYSVLLELPNLPLVCVLRAQVALDLDWPARALRAAWAGEESGEEHAFSGQLKTLEGVALAATANPERAVTALDQAVSLCAGADADLSRGVLYRRALFARALAHVDMGNASAAWEDLTALLQVEPGHPQAVAVLKSL